VSGCCQGGDLDDGLAPGEGGVASTEVLDRVEDDVVIGNTAVNTVLYTFTVPAGRVVDDGATLRLRLRGDMLCAIAGTPSFTLRVRFGGLLWYQDGALGRTNNPVAVPWRLDVEVARKSATTFYGSAEYDGANAIGAVAVGGGDLGNTGASSSPTSPLDSLGDRACDWSIAQALTVEIQLGVADPNLVTTLRGGTLVLE
jgi:hypothetical protein